MVHQADYGQFLRPWFHNSLRYCTLAELLQGGDDEAAELVKE